MNIYKSIGNICRYKFSNQTTKIFAQFDEDFYVKNYLNNFSQQGFPQADLQIANKKIKLIGLPRSGVQETIMEDMTELLMKNEDQNNFLIQLDPSPYLFAKRQLYKQYHAKIDPILIDNLFEQLPVLPLDTNELQIDLSIFDALSLIKNNPQLNIEQKSELLGYLNGERQGYFLQMFNKIAQAKSKNEIYTDQLKQESDLLANRLADIIQNVIPYSDQSNTVDLSQLTLYQALYMTILKGSNIHLIGLSQIYQRIYGGLLIPLPNLKEMFMDICKHTFEAKNMNLVYFFEFTTMLWKQKIIEYYLLYTINRYLKTQKVQEVTVLVDSLHYDPLRIAILAQKNSYLKDIENSYFSEFTYPQVVKQENDQQMLEKHAILDCLFEFQIWKEPCINNPFPYLSTNYNQMNKEEQKEIQKMFYTYHTQYSSIIKEIGKKHNL